MEIKKRGKIKEAIMSFELKEIGKIDNVKSPKHYRLEGLDIESKDVIKSLLGVENYIG